MDRLITEPGDRLRNPEAYTRDNWVKAQAEKIPAGSRVLDAGAGASKYRPFFAHCRYQTQDFCQYEGPLVQYLNPIDYVCEITSIPLEKGSLDAILCTEVFEHLVDPMAALREFGRLVKPGGRLLVTAPLLSHLHMEPYHYYGGFTHYWYRHWLPRCGFEIDEITPVGGPGLSSVIFNQAFYNTWSAREKNLGGPMKLVSMAARAFAKVMVHGVLPRTAPRLDRWLGSDVICSGYLVAAVRTPE